MPNDGFPGSPQAPPTMAPPAFSSPPPTYRAPPMYRDGKGMATAIAALLPVYLVLDVLAVALKPGGTPLSDAADTAIGVSGVLGFGVFVALAILTPMWLVRAHRNAEALTGAPLGTGAGWTAGAWFIPVVGGFLAAGPVSKLWARGPGGGKALPMLWAILWSVSQVFILVSFFIGFSIGFSAVFQGMDNDGLTDAEAERVAAEAERATWPVSLAQVLVVIVSGVCMWLTVRGIQAWQSRAAQRQAAPPGGGWGMTGAPPGAPPLGR